jgi:hypothetical protein
VWAGECLFGPTGAFSRHFQLRFDCPDDVDFALERRNIVWGDEARLQFQQIYRGFIAALSWEYLTSARPGIAHRPLIYEYAPKNYRG